MNNKRQAFTLAEGVIRHCERSVAIQNKGISPSPQPSPQRVEGEITLNPCLRKCAFTLAEVLIVIGVIGIVAAITLPGLMTTIKDKVDSNRMQVIEKRLLQGLNQLNTLDNGLSVPYNSTEDFVRALSKHMKITTICGKDELKNCLPYDEIKYEKNEKIESAKVEDLKTAGSLKIKEDGFEDTAGFVMADGTPFIVSYNKKCHDLDTSYTLADPDKPMKEISPCLAGVYDINGAKSPNKFGTKVVDGKTLNTADIISLNGGKIGTPCVMEFETNGKSTCITTKAKLPSPISQTDCDKYQSDMGIKYCNQVVVNDESQPDLWAGAVLECYKRGERLPSEDELTEIAKQLYGDNTIATLYKSGLTWQNKSVATTLGIGDSASSFLWSSKEYSPHSAYSRYFYSTDTNRGYNTRYYSYIWFICVEK